jgi:hypothetical protein
MLSGVCQLRWGLSGLGDLLDGDGIEERHGGAGLFSDDLDGVLGFLGAVNLIVSAELSTFCTSFAAFEQPNRQ